MAMMMVLLDEANGDFSFRQELVETLARLGVTSVAVLRDQGTVGIVLEGWLFDPARSADTVVEGFGAESGARTFHPVLQLAVSNATEKGGRNVRELPSEPA